MLRPVKPDSLRPVSRSESRTPSSGAELLQRSTILPLEDPSELSAPGTPVVVSTPPPISSSEEKYAPALSADATTSRISPSKTGAGTVPELLVVPRSVASTPEHATPSHGTPVASPGVLPGSRVPGRFWKGGVWWVAGLVVALAAAGLTWYFASHRGTAASTVPTTIAVARVRNATGEGSLSGILSTALQLAAAQSPRLSIRSSDEYLRGLRAIGHGSGGEVSMEQARDAARAIGAGVLVFSDIRIEGTSYVVALRLVDVVKGTRLAEFSETAASREQIAAAVDRLAADLRSALGESSDSVARTTVPLSKEATSNLDALESFASGTNLEVAGTPAEAILAFQHAVALEPHFTQAYLRLAALYRDQHAELAAAHAATEAQANSTTAGARTQWLAQASMSMLAAGDYGHAAEVLKQLLAVYPEDLEALNAVALTQLLQGQFAGAQSTAESVLSMFRYDAEAMGTEELALIVQGRPEAAMAVETQAQAVGIPHPRIAAQAAAAGSGTQIPSPGETSLSGAVAASLLDAAGRFSEGASRWQEMTDQVRASPVLSSGAAYAQGAAALNRALAGECDPALRLASEAQALPAGPVATFDTGEALALCGSTDRARQSLAALTAAYSNGSAAQDYLIPDLGATIAWKTGDPAGALQTLDAARQFDAISLTAYLRGLIELSARQPQLSIVQFQSLLSHRGTTTVFNPETYALAQLGLGRAYAFSGDTANSSMAYGRFLDLWTSADPGVAALAEARSHTHR